MNDFKHSEEPHYKFDPLNVLEMKVSYRNIYLVGSFGKGFWENQESTLLHFAPCDVFPVSVGVSYRLSKSIFFLEPQANLKDYIIKYSEKNGSKNFTESEFSTGYEISCGISVSDFNFAGFYAYDKIFSSKRIKIDYWGLRIGYRFDASFLKGIINEK
jgi:hypothetical protein